ncbi:hypothetical protein H6P81_012428 [Aristolochia fimbriata]|uniref:Uncharacterized protein n=1 Tax=Aristolochia fimbriata TaxID=158543 RepID=A0AAV7EBS8_ARIFI|nr:hypothetical protein H6P81_012428 [Aristolochia fimbriata]
MGVGEQRDCHPEKPYKPQTKMLCQFTPRLNKTLVYEASMIAYVGLGLVDKLGTCRDVVVPPGLKKWVEDSFVASKAGQPCRWKQALFARERVDRGFYYQEDAPAPHSLLGLVESKKNILQRQNIGREIRIKGRTSGTKEAEGELTTITLSLFWVLAYRPCGRETMTGERKNFAMQMGNLSIK